MIMAIIKSTLGGVVEDHNMDYEQFGSKCLHWNRFKFESGNGDQKAGWQGGRQIDWKAGKEADRQEEGRQVGRKTDRQQTDSQADR
jgi:hypothetical protein